MSKILMIYLLLLKDARWEALDMYLSVMHGHWCKPKEVKQPWFSSLKCFFLLSSIFTYWWKIEQTWLDGQENVGDWCVLYLVLGSWVTVSLSSFGSFLSGQTRYICFVCYCWVSACQWISVHGGWMFVGNLRKKWLVAQVYLPTHCTISSSII